MKQSFTRCALDASWMFAARVLSAACVMLAACDASDQPSDAAAQADAGGQAGRDAEPVGDASANEDALRSAVGTFLVQLIAAVPASEDVPAVPAQTSISGLIHADEVPAMTIWDLVGDESGCRLLEPRTPFCDPECGAGVTCAEDDTCVPRPGTLDVGTVTLGGLRDESGATQLSLMPLPPSNTYQPRGSSTLAYPPFEENDVVTLAADGGEHAPFELTASGIAPLEVLSPEPLLLDPDAATVMRWTPPGSGSSSRIVVRVDISHHGGQKGELVCEVEDDGEFELPAALVQGLIDLGVAGYPTLDVVRESTNEPFAGAPGIALTIASSKTLAIEIPGAISCDDEQDFCPPGQTCQLNRLCN